MTLLDDDKWQTFRAQSGASVAYNHRTGFIKQDDLVATVQAMHAMGGESAIEHGDVVLLGAPNKLQVVQATSST